MSEHTQPSPAQLLAAVLRVVAPGQTWTDLDGGGWRLWRKLDAHERRIRFPSEVISATSKDDLARVVAMLTPEQRGNFNAAMTRLAMLRGPSILPFEVVTAPASTWLAALVAATGVRAERCPSCGVYPADDGGDCAGCEAYREHQA